MSWKDWMKLCFETVFFLPLCFWRSLKFELQLQEIRKTLEQQLEHDMEIWVIPQEIDPEADAEDLRWN